MKMFNGTNSLVNGLMADSKSKTPEVGDGATVLHYTDRTAATVVFVSKDGKTVMIQTDKATRVDSNGMSECQEYTFESNMSLEGASTYTLRSNGAWVRKGSGYKNGQRILIGHRSKYHDYSF